MQLHVTVLDAVEVIAGVTTHVVEERESHDGELVEVSRNYFVEASDGTVCYFGEDVDIYEDGAVVSHEGAWRGDGPGNQPGIIMPADPRPGTKFVMESAPGVAEDQGTVVGSGPVEVPAGAFPDAIRVKELNPLDGDRGLKVIRSRRRPRYRWYRSAREPDLLRGRCVRLVRRNFGAREPVTDATGEGAVAEPPPPRAIRRVNCQPSTPNSQNPASLGIASFAVGNWELTAVRGSYGFTLT